MSFSTRVKKDIVSLNFKNKCCKKAFFHGALMGADISDRNVTLKVSEPEVADLLTYIASTVYKIREIDISETRRGFCNTITMKFCLPTAIKLLSDIDNGIDTDMEFDSLFACNSCLSYFFCGLFCAVGSVSDPEKSYTLELSLPNMQRAEKINDIFTARTDLTPGMTKRKNGYSLFFRNGEGVGGFLTLCHLSTIVFDFVNQQFENQLRADENRATNLVASNIQRAVNAGTPQIQAINKLIEKNRFYLLSDELQETAKLRMQNPELSLKALASLHNPPITKSGLNHRLEKIIKLSQEI